MDSTKPTRSFVIFAALLAVMPYEATEAARVRPDTKIFVGSSCQPLNGFQAGDFTTFVDAMQNIVTAVRRVVCPIVRDNPNNTNGIRSVRVRVQSDGFNPLQCTLFSFGPLGGDPIETHSASTSSAEPDTIALDVDESARGGTYSILCDLPPGAAVFGYEVTEPPRTER